MEKEIHRVSTTVNVAWTENVAWEYIIGQTFVLTAASMVTEEQDVMSCVSMKIANLVEHKLLLKIVMRATMVTFLAQLKTVHLFVRLAVNLVLQAHIATSVNLASTTNLVRLLVSLPIVQNIVNVPWVKIIAFLVKLDILINQLPVTVRVQLTVSIVFQRNRVLSVTMDFITDMNMTVVWVFS